MVQSRQLVLLQPPLKKDSKAQSAMPDVKVSPRMLFALAAWSVVHLTSESKQLHL